MPYLLMSSAVLGVINLKALLTDERLMTKSLILNDILTTGFYSNAFSLVDSMLAVLKCKIHMLLFVVFPHTLYKGMLL